MHFLSVLPLALSASAFLVPASVEPLHIKTLPSSAKSDKVTLQCDDCPTDAAQIAPGTLKFSGLGKTELTAIVVVTGDRVDFNGQQIYPPSNGVPLSILSDFSVDKDISKKLPAPVSSSIEYKPVEYVSDLETEMFIHPISIEILAIEDHVVHVESVEIRVADVNGELGLLPSRIRAYEPSPFTESCTTVWCRVKGTIAEKYAAWRAAAAGKIKSWKGCSGKKQPGFAKGRIPIKGGPAKFGGSLRPGRHGEKPHHPHHGHHGHHSHHGHSHSFGSFARYLLDTVLLPACFGLSAGIILGAFSWMVVNEVRRIRAARRGEYIVVEQIEVEEGRGDLPPKYEEAYRAPQDETEDEKKELLQ